MTDRMWILRRDVSIEVRNCSGVAVRLGELVDIQPPYSTLGKRICAPRPRCEFAGEEVASRPFSGPRVQLVKRCYQLRLHDRQPYPVSKTQRRITRAFRCGMNLLNGQRCLPAAAALSQGDPPVLQDPQNHDLAVRRLALKLERAKIRHNQSLRSFHRSGVVDIDPWRRMGESGNFPLLTQENVHQLRSTNRPAGRNPPSRSWAENVSTAGQ